MRKLIDYRIAGLVLAVAGAFSTQACDAKDSPVGDLAKQCGLTCSEKGILEGNASISGIQSIDAFFGAVVNFKGKAELVSGNINAELTKMKLSVGLTADDDPAMIKAAMIAKFKLDAKAGVKVAFKPAQCAVSAKATIEATAKCDASFDPGKAEVECHGGCEADATVEAKCDANATVSCKGTAPSLACEGTCKGSCELKAAAKCEGTCKGTCSGNCSVKDASGQCAGSCDAMCEGTCEMSGSAKCEGSCKGECTYTPPDGKCEGGASVTCEAKADATVKCNGKCTGDFEPPMAKAECQASAKADASVNVECTPPSVDISYQFAATADAEAQANFEAFLVGFKGSFGAIVAASAQSDVVVQAGVDMIAAGKGAVEGAVKELGASADLKASIGAGCALTALGDVKTLIDKSTGDLKASATASASLVGSFK
jgi:hypothetical protein